MSLSLWSFILVNLDLCESIYNKIQEEFGCGSNNEKRKCKCVNVFNKVCIIKERYFEGLKVR